ncbi:armadillo-type protein [Chytriomyces sp. MP71]|nr:armadillo-type protein [Chytriomyces sp. MP71]
MAEEDVLALPLAQRLVHKNWKARVSGYDELAAKMRTTMDPDSNAAEFRDASESLKSAVSDANAAAHEAGIGLLLAFAENAPQQVISRTRSLLIPIVVDKALAATRAGTRQKALDAILMYVEVENKADAVLEEIIPALDHKTPKNVVATVVTLRETLRLFGSKVVPVKPLLKQLPKLFDHKDGSVRNEATALAIEMYKWLGPAILPSLNDLKPVQLKDLNDQFETLGNVRSTPERLVRSEMVKRARVGYVAEDDTAPGPTAVQPEPEPVDVFDISDPVNVLDKLPPKFYETLAAPKWSDRKEILEALLVLVKVPKLEDGRYGELVNVLAKKINDAHVLVLSLAINCIEHIARGLRSAFSQYRGIVLSPLLEKLKEKKTAVLDSLRACLDAVFLSVAGLAEILDDLTTAAKHKNPQVRALSVAWLARCLSALRKPPPKTELKAVAELLVRGLEDADAACREACNGALGVLMRIVGERALAGFVAGVDEVRMAKMREACEGAIVKVSAVGAVAKAPVAAAPVAAPPVARAAASVGKSVLVKPTSAGAKKKPAGSGSASGSASASSVSTAPAKKKGGAEEKEEMLTFKFTDDNAVPWVAENFAEMDLKAFGDANWKNRLAACHDFLEALKAKTSTEPEAVIRFLSKTPGWKESNFQVMTAVVSIFEHLAKQLSASKAALSLTISNLAEKLGDAKLKKVSGECLGSFAEQYGLQFVLKNMYEPLGKAKSPKVLADALLWIHQSVLEFGVAGLDVRLLVDFVKTALLNTNASVRANGVVVLGGLRMFVGPDVRSFVADLSPQLLATVDAELEKVAATAPPAPARVVVHTGAVATEDPMDNLFPRVDLTSRVTPELLEKLGHAQWGLRKEALEELAGIIEGANKRLKPTVGEIPAALKARLNDTNRNLGILAVEICGHLAIAVGKPFARHAGMLIGPMATLLGDQKVHVRTAAINALENVHAACGIEVFVVPSAGALVTDQPNLRKDLLKFLGDKLEAVKSSGGNLPKVEELLKPILMCLQDKNSDVRKFAAVVLAFVAEDVGIGYVQDRAGDWYHGSALASLKPFFAPLQDMVRGGGSGGGSSSPKTGKRVTISTETSSSSSSGGSAPKASVRVSSSSATLKKRPATMPPPAKAAASPVPAAGDGIPVLTADLRAKEVRAGQDRGMTKWTFETPRKDLVDFLADQCQNNLSEGVVLLLFSTDHYKEKDFLQGLSLLDDNLSATLSNGDSGLRARYIANTDLILKYLTIRFFDTNTSMLIKVLDLLEHLFTLLDEDGVVLSDYEAGSFLPFFITKVGDNKETMRLKVRAIFKQIPKVYPPSKFFAYLLNSLTSKNSRTRTECLEELGDLIKKNGMSVCGVQSKTLPVIAAQISDSDAKVRNAALGTVTNAYMLLGDAVYKLLGRISDKDKSLLEEKVKRLPPPSILVPPVVVVNKPPSPLFQKKRPPPAMSSEDSADFGPVAAGLVGIPKTSGAVSGIKKEFSLDLDKMNNLPRQSSQLRLNQQQQQQGEGLSSASSSSDLANDSLMIDYLVTQITAIDAYQSIDALKQLEKLVIGPPESIIPYIDQIISAVTLQIRLAFSSADLSSTATTRLCKHLVNILVQIFSIQAIAKTIQKSALHQCVQELLNRLLDPALQGFEQGAQLAKALNVLMVRVLDNCDRNLSFGVLLALLEQSANATLHCLPDDIPLQAKYTELVMKCLWKLTKVIPQLVQEGSLDATQLIASVHNFLQVSPPNEWKRRAAEKIIPQADMPLRTVKTILHELCNSLGEKIMSCLGGVPDPARSHAVGYIRQMLGHPGAAVAAAPVVASTSTPEPIPENVYGKRVESPAVVDYDGTLQAMRRSLTVPARDSGVSRLANISRTNQAYATQPQSEQQQQQSRSNEPPKSLSKRASFAVERSASAGPLSEVEADAQLTLIFSRISAKDETKEGIKDLYLFRKRHPDCEPYVLAHLGRTGNYFQGYIKRGLAVLEAEESSEAGGAAESASSLETGRLNVRDAVDSTESGQSTEAYRDTLAKLQQRLHGGVTSTPSESTAPPKPVQNRFSMPPPRDGSMIGSGIARAVTASSMGVRLSVPPPVRATDVGENKPPTATSGPARAQTVEQLKQRLAAMKMQQMNNSHSNADSS